MFSNKVIRRLPSTTRVILLQYYREADIVAALEDLEEFECRGITRIAELAEWLIIKKTWKK